jgi:hypothetical protein
MSHRKNRHLPGVLDFHSVEAPGMSVCPRNMAAYAKDVENWPVMVHFKSGSLGYLAAGQCCPSGITIPDIGSELG